MTYTLQTKTGEAVLMKNGEPFTYSNRDLATLGRKFLEQDRGRALVVVKN